MTDNARGEGPADGHDVSRRLRDAAMGLVTAAFYYLQGKPRAALEEVVRVEALLKSAKAAMLDASQEEKR